MSDLDPQGVTINFLRLRQLPDLSRTVLRQFFVMSTGNTRIRTDTGNPSAGVPRANYYYFLSGSWPPKHLCTIGRSAGSVLLNFGAIVESARSPFVGPILTGSLIVQPGSIIPGLPLPSVSDDTPLRWGGLDPGYITTSDRTLCYPSDNATFSPRMIVFDNFVKDVGTVAIFSQTGITSLTTQYSGPVAKIVGSENHLFSTRPNRCADVAALTAAERDL
ncbi:hypothetical protein K438DRAFT_1973842 [Mycena galopus ATCC 62051]|nr:hypothetical protein K438DRAFT_1973842 [Mycena galopus ATCC 62051]